MGSGKSSTISHVQTYPSKTKTENMDAVYVASQASYIKRKVAQMMTVHLQVEYPNPTSMFMSFQSKLKNMDMNLSFDGPSPHLSLSDEPVESTVKVEGDQMILHTVIGYLAFQKN